MVVEVEICMDILSEGAVHGLHSLVALMSGYGVSIYEPQFGIWSENIIKDFSHHSVAENILEQEIGEDVWILCEIASFWRLTVDNKGLTF
jgi:hypothetical protein